MTEKRVCALCEMECLETEYCRGCGSYICSDHPRIFVSHDLRDHIVDFDDDEDRSRR